MKREDLTHISEVRFTAGELGRRGSVWRYIRRGKAVKNRWSFFRFGVSDDLLSIKQSIGFFNYDLNREGNIQNRYAMERFERCDCKSWCLVKAK